MVKLDYYTPVSELSDHDLTISLVDFTKTLSGVVAAKFPKYGDKIRVYRLGIKSYTGALRHVSSSKNIFIQSCNRAQDLHDEYLRRGFKYHQSWSLIKRISKAPW